MQKLFWPKATKWIARFPPAKQNALNCWIFSVASSMAQWVFRARIYKVFFGAAGFLILGLLLLRVETGSSRGDKSWVRPIAGSVKDACQCASVPQNICTKLWSVSNKIQIEAVRRDNETVVGGSAGGRDASHRLRARSVTLFQQKKRIWIICPSFRKKKWTHRMNGPMLKWVTIKCSQNWLVLRCAWSRARRLLTNELSSTQKGCAWTDVCR